MFQDIGMVPDDLFESFHAKSAEWVCPSRFRHTLCPFTEYLRIFQEARAIILIFAAPPTRKIAATAGA
jgi:hypothetical protein